MPPNLYLRNNFCYYSLMKYKKEAIIAEYKETAAGYDQGSADCGWSAPNVVKKVLESRGLLKPNTHIIDFAAGTGLLSEEFRKSTEGSTLHITALDLSRDMLNELGKKNIADALQQQDITESWDVKQNNFDIATATGVGEYLTDEQLSQTINNAARAVKEGGHVALTYRPEDNSGDAQKLHSPETVQDIFTQAGLKVLEDNPFSAYKADNGETINHHCILAQKLSFKT